MKPLLFFIFLLLVLGFTAAPLVMKAKKVAEKYRAIGCAAQLGLAMDEFDSVYGHYPNTTIPEDLLEKYPQTDRSDSNYILGQLIASEMTDSEQLFDTDRSRGWSNKPEQADNIISPLSELLRAGECELSCVTLEGDQPLSSKSANSGTPLLVNHIIPGTDRFDPECYRGEMIYLRVDLSVATARINAEGKTLFESGPGTVWEDNVPRLHHPLFYQTSYLSPSKKKWLLPVGAVSLIVLVGFFCFRKGAARKSGE